MSEGANDLISATGMKLPNFELIFSYFLCGLKPSNV
uniref:Uncharacterized protein n=1 Tax=viral metagenome TaxID=1070528 RepID=A0A6C0JGR5_9ZZZZ